MATEQEQDDLDPDMYLHDEDFELPSHRENDSHTKLEPRNGTDAYQGYLSELLVRLEEEYEETDRVDVDAFAPGTDPWPRDVRVTHPAGSIGDSIRKLTEDTRSARIVDIASVRGRGRPDGAKDGESYIEIYLQPEVPEELLDESRERYHQKE